VLTRAKGDTGFAYQLRNVADVVDVTVGEHDVPDPALLFSGECSGQASCAQGDRVIDDEARYQVNDGFEVVGDPGS
jgi:hypothetical protein